MVLSNATALLETAPFQVGPNRRFDYFLTTTEKKPKNHSAPEHVQCKPCASAKKCSCHEALHACISMHPKACKATECWQYGRKSCFVTFLVLDPKLAIRVRRDEANGHNDSSRSSMPRHASESKWTWMHVLASSCESCHCDRWLRLVSLLWQNWESRPERPRNMIHEHAICPHGGTQLAQFACHTTPAQEWHDMQSAQTECDTQFAQIACQTSPAQEWCDVQSVQTECNTQLAQIACHTTPAQEWCDMQSVQSVGPMERRQSANGAATDRMECSNSSFEHSNTFFAHSFEVAFEYSFEYPFDESFCYLSSIYSI